MIARHLALGVLVFVVACSSPSSTAPSHGGPGGPEDGGVDGAGSSVDATTPSPVEDGALDVVTTNAADGSQARDGSVVAESSTSDASEDVANLGPPPSPVCTPGASWGPGMQLAISTDGDDIMGAITPDELTIAWIADSEAGVSVYYADRPSAQAAFGAPAMASPSGVCAPTKVALSPEGLRLLVVATNHKSFEVVTRNARGDAFNAPPAGGEVDGINSNVNQGEADFFLDDPVVGASDETFYYSLYGSQFLDTLLESTRADASSDWPNGTSIQGTSDEFAASGSLLRHPTGISADDLTLFFWDDVAMTEKAAWRPRTTEPFAAPATLTGMRQAVPNGACTRLYYSAPGSAGGLDLFVATSE
jgi:hypothetical protein